MLKTCTHTRTHVRGCTSHSDECGHTVTAATPSLPALAPSCFLPALAPSSMGGGRSTSVSRRNLQTENKFDPRSSSGSVRQCPACCLVCCSTGRATGVCAPRGKSNPKPLNRKTLALTTKLTLTPHDCDMYRVTYRTGGQNLYLSIGQSDNI